MVHSAFGESCSFSTYFAPGPSRAPDRSCELREPTRPPSPCCSMHFQTRTEPAQSRASERKHGERTPGPKLWQAHGPEVSRLTFKIVWVFGPVTPLRECCFGVPWRRERNWDPTFSRRQECAGVRDLAREHDGSLWRERAWVRLLLRPKSRRTAGLITPGGHAEAAHRSRSRRAVLRGWVPPLPAPGEQPRTEHVQTQSRNHETSGGKLPERHRLAQPPRYGPMPN
jgi:hypothetical protein